MTPEAQDPEQDKATIEKRVNIPVTGMMCASCVAHVTEALKEVPGVRHVEVNLATGQAQVEYRPRQASLASLEQAINDSGYGVGRDVAFLQITGMTCASCVEKIQSAVSNLPGVSKVSINLATGTGRVEYLGSVTSARQSDLTSIPASSVVDNNIKLLAIDSET